jgi:diadenosine tetraphosphatase ApaH/serine/threonine PP2A family protein phosphatase
MRYLVLADVHANLDALRAVLEHSKRYGWKRILCLGDVVGYGAEPSECISTLRSYELICLQGNHDAACVGQLSVEHFNPYARKCIEWTKEKLKARDRRFLAELPKFFSMDYLIAVHGSTNNFLEEYMNASVAQDCLNKVVENLIICGHVHVPFVYTELKGKQQGKYDLVKGMRAINYANKRMVVSMPAVGQPRDGDPRAGYGILDFESRQLFIERVEYDVNSAVEKILAAALPEFIAQRLKSGL